MNREIFACICGICRIDTWYSLHVHSSLLKVLNWNQLKVLKGTGPGSHFFEARSHQGLRAKRWERCELVTLASRFNYQLISTDHWRTACLHVSALFIFQIFQWIVLWVVHFSLEESCSGSGADQNESNIVELALQFHESHRLLCCHLWCQF